MDTLEKFQDMAVEEPFAGIHGYWLQVFDGKGLERLILWDLILLESVWSWLPFP